MILTTAPIYYIRNNVAYLIQEGSAMQVLYHTDSHMRIITPYGHEVEFTLLDNKDWFQYAQGN